MMDNRKDIEAIADALRLGRGCNFMEINCPFCNWGPDELTKEFDETGCIWLAEVALASITKQY